MTTLDELTLHARQTLAAHDADLSTLATRAEHTGQHQAYDEARADANEIHDAILRQLLALLPR